MNKKLLSVILCVVLVLAQISVLAAPFTDVNATKYSWAIDAINEMSQLGIINGYDEVTFGPEDPVKRVDALLLVSRIAGSVAEGEKDYLKKAYDTYVKSVSSLGFSAYEETLSYLLYRNIYTESELGNFLKSGLGNSELKRYEAAIILVKLIGAESVVKQNTMPVLSFDDSASIPSSAKAYVEYCYENGLMQGMSATEFSPNTSVTRAQMAVLLKKAMDKLNLKYLRGTVVEVNTVTESIKFAENNGSEKTVHLMNDIPVKLNGKDVEKLEDINVGDRITCIYSSSEPVFVELLKVIPDSVITGVYTGKTTNTAGRKISIKKNITDTESSEYALSDDCTIVINGAVSDISKLSSDLFLTLTIKEGVVSNISAEKKEKTISGTISKFIYDTPSKMEITFSNNTTQAFELISDVTVKRNNAGATVSDLMVGDKVTITLVYDKIANIVATSVVKKVEGTIEEIVISANPSIKVNTDSAIVTCALDASNIEIIVNGNVESDVYDLRLGDKAKLTIESSTVTKIEIESGAVTVDTVNIVGTVANVDTNYMCITLNMTDGSKQQVFVKKNASIIDGATQKARKLESIKPGDTITAVITSNGFTSEAISIVILAAE